VENCFECNLLPNKCLRCNDGYYLTDSDSKCVVPIDCPSNSFANNNGVCGSC